MLICAQAGQVNIIVVFLRDRVWLDGSRLAEVHSLQQRMFSRVAKYIISHFSTSVPG